METSPRHTLFLVWAVIAGLIVTAPAPAQLTPIFSDGFESGDLSAWSLSTGLAPEVFRFSDLALRDPHVFVDLGPLGCADFTDDAVPFGLAPSFNSIIETAITDDDNGDGFLDLSSLLLFRPLDVTAAAERLDLGGGLCSAPLVSTSCDPDPEVTAQTTSYDGLAAGLCLSAVAGTTSGYSPSVDETSAPCFVSASGTLVFDLDGVEVPLEDAQLAAGWLGDPPVALTAGLIRGFLPESVADSILLPSDTPLVGDQPLSVLLPGGQGNCAAGDDRDVHESVTGWWLYLAFTADEVPYSGG